MSQLRKVSFIIPAFNAGRFITETLDSVSRQSYRNLEIVVVDDGSTDETVKVAQEYPDGRVSLYKQDNAGPSSARNLGLKHASGEFIWYLDADDLILPGAVDVLTAKLDGSPSLTGALGRWSLVDERARVISTPMKAADSDELNTESHFAKMLLRTLFPVGSIVFRRAMIEEVGGWDESLRCAEDRDFYLRILERGCRFGAVDDEVFRYRHHPENATSSLSRVESHTCAFLEKWLGANGRAPEEFSSLKPYAWAVAYLYMARRCNSGSSATELDRLVNVATRQLECADPESTKINDVLWDSAGLEHHKPIRSVLWRKASGVVADYCWANGARAIRTGNFRKASSWLVEILANQPSYLVEKVLHKCLG